MTEVAALSEANGEPPTPGNLDGKLLHENLCRHHIPFNKDKLKVAIGLGIAFINDLGRVGTSSLGPPISMLSSLPPFSTPLNGLAHQNQPYTASRLV